MVDIAEYNAKVIAEFRANEGRVAGREGANHELLLLTYSGRRSGRSYTTPMTYGRDGERLFVYASKGGLPEHPEWYLNLVADPGVVVEIGDERYDATATPLGEPERERQYAAHAARNARFAEYQAKTARPIPVVELTRRAG